MKITSLFLGLLLTVYASANIEAAKKKVIKPVVIKVTTNHAKALYKCGEKAVFTVTVKNNQDKLIKQGTVKATLTLDGLKKVDAKSFNLAENNPFTITGTLPKPGFLRLTCYAKINKKTYSGLGAVGYEPLKITQGNPEPRDFDQFWKNSREQLAKQPLDLKLKLIEKQSNAKQNSYQISFANINSTRIYGFLSIPKGKGPFPAIVSVPGAGPGWNSSSWATKWGNQGVIGLLMNVHSYNPYVEKKKLMEEYKKQNKLKRYYLQGAPDRDKFFFKKSILGINRAINYVAARPEFDKKHFVVYGSSQGGAHTLILAGLNKNLTAAIANVPALCDHGGYLKNRMPGWPKLVLIGYRKAPGHLEMSGYFDTVNFARRITVPTVICVGFIDRTCSPSSVYAAYNTIKAPKKIINEPTMGHSHSTAFRKFAIKWEKSQLGLTKPIAPCR
jgi:cephalosporin-C deacetylase